MSDLHAAFRSRTLEELDDVFKTQHPEYLMAPMTDRQLPSELTEQRLWVALEYTHPEVRQHRLDYIAKTATIHDFDGYELDFNRMGIHFPMGQGRQKTHLMTDLMQQIRDRLNAIGEERGRPYTLAVHVMDSLETNLEIGLDVGTWAREGLVTCYWWAWDTCATSWPSANGYAWPGRRGCRSIRPSIPTPCVRALGRRYGASLCFARGCGRTPTTI